MKALSSLAVFGIGVGLCFWITGCEAQSCDNSTGSADGGTQSSGGNCVQLKSLKKWTAQSPKVLEANWLPGKLVQVDSANGQVSVVQGSTAGKVRASFLAFTLRAYDTPTDQIQTELEGIPADVTGDFNGDTGAVHVNSGIGGHTGSGNDLTVELPPEFDGPLTVKTSNGDTNVKFAGAAVSVNVTDNNGSCSVSTGSSATGVGINCGNGDLTASIGGVPAGADTRTFATGNGAITLNFSGITTEKFIVKAWAKAGGTATFNNPPGACAEAAGGTSGARTIACNGAVDGVDPTYDAQADGTSLADVIVNF